MKYHRESGIPLNKHEVPLNSVEMQNFATKLLAGSQMAMEEGDDPAEPLQVLVKHIEPLNIPDQDHAIGITADTLANAPHLKTLMAMLMQTKVFKQDADNACYILNPDDKYAQKVMVFLRMGMKENPTSHDVVGFLTKEQYQPTEPNYNQHPKKQMHYDEDIIEPSKEPKFDKETATSSEAVQDESLANDNKSNEWGNTR